MSESLDFITAELLMARSRKEQLDGELRKINQEIRGLEGKLIEAMNAAGNLDAIKLHGHSFSLSTKYNVKKIDEASLFEWLREQGFGGTIKETIHAATLTKAVTESLTEEGVMPPGVEVTDYRAVSVRKA